MAYKDKIKNFCEATKAKEVEVCQDNKGKIDFRVVNGEKNSRMCAKVKCDEL